MIKSPLLRLKGFLYRGKIREAITTLGLDERLRPVWQKLLMATVSDTTTLCINGKDVNFHTTTYREHSRISSLVGESEVVESLLDDLQDGDVFFDIGANIGLYSCLACAFDRDIDTFAFEPHSDNVSRLSNNLSLNGESWTCCQIALGQSNSLVPFHIASERAGESRHSVSVEESPVKIFQVSGDSLIEQGALPNPSVLKIDVEGSELSVLKGLEQSLHGIRVIYCEVHEEANGQSGVEEFLSSQGYETEIIQRDEQTYHIRALSAT